MKLAIIGSRDFNDYEFMKETILQHININDIDLIISGGAKGADSLGRRFADDYQKEFKEYLPDWSLYGRSAGVKRNHLIVSHCDLLIAFWDGKSKGTESSLKIAKKLKKSFKIITYENKL